MSKEFEDFFRANIVAMDLGSHKRFSLIEMRVNKSKVSLFTSHANLADTSKRLSVRYDPVEPSIVNVVALEPRSLEGKPESVILKEEIIRKVKSLNFGESIDINISGMKESVARNLLSVSSRVLGIKIKTWSSSSALFFVTRVN